MKRIITLLTLVVSLFFTKTTVAQQNGPCENPDYVINVIYHFDSKILKGNNGFTGNALVEIKNNTTKDLPLPSLYVDAVKNLLLHPRNIKPDVSIFYEVKWDAGSSESPPLLLYMALSKEEVAKIMKKDPADYYPGFRGRSFEISGFEGNKMCGRGKGSFRCPECLKNYYLLPIDTLLNIKDTFLLQKKYKLYNIANNFYVLHDSIQKKALLAELYTNAWKPKLISSNEIEIQKEKFIYTDIVGYKDFYYSDKIPVYSDKKHRIAALIKITNHSKEYLYIKEKIDVPDNLGYKLSYFGQERKEKNRTITALAPNGTLVVKLVVEYEKFEKSYIDLNLNTLFINCPNTKQRINFTPDYFIEP